MQINSPVFVRGESFSNETLFKRDGWVQVVHKSGKNSKKDVVIEISQEDIGDKGRGNT